MKHKVMDYMVFKDLINPSDGFYHLKKDEKIIGWIPVKNNKRYKYYFEYITRLKVSELDKVLEPKVVAALELEMVRAVCEGRPINPYYKEQYNSWYSFCFKYDLIEAFWNYELLVGGFL